MRRFLILVAVLLPLWGFSQEFVGQWGGTFSVNDTRLTLVFHIQHQDDAYVAQFDSPDQNAMGLKVDRVRVEGHEICLEMNQIKASYQGALVSKGMIMGTFMQGGLKFPVILTPHEYVYPQRPQEPLPPYPYTEQEVEFASRDEGVTLHGTLTLPEGKPLAVVVMVTGSGMQNRDEELFGHKPFKVIADRLTREGVAVLRYDDRGWGASKEETAALTYTTTHHLTLDALGAVDYLRGLEQLRNVPIGALGHSEGGTIAFRMAAKDRHVKFIISMAGSMLRGDRVLQFQIRRQLLQMGLPMDTTDQCVAYRQMILDHLRTHSLEDLQTNAVSYKAQLKASPLGATIPNTLRTGMLQIYDAVVKSPWLHNFIQYNPTKDIIIAGRRPILSLNGMLDSQVEAGEHQGRLKLLAQKSKRLTVKTYDNLNHLFQPCKTGLVNEYSKIDTTISEEVLQDIVTWIHELYAK